MSSGKWIKNSKGSYTLQKGEHTLNAYKRENTKGSKDLWAYTIQDSRGQEISTEIGRTLGSVKGFAEADLRENISSKAKPTIPVGAKAGFAAKGSHTALNMASHGAVSKYYNADGSPRDPNDSSTHKTASESKLDSLVGPALSQNRRSFLKARAVRLEEKERWENRGSRAKPAELTKPVESVTSVGSDLSDRMRAHSSGRTSGVMANAIAQAKATKEGYAVQAKQDANASKRAIIVANNKEKSSLREALKGSSSSAVDDVFSSLGGSLGSSARGAFNKSIPAASIVTPVATQDDSAAYALMEKEYAVQAVAEKKASKQAAKDRAASNKSRAMKEKAKARSLLSQTKADDKAYAQMEKDYAKEAILGKAESKGLEGWLALGAKSSPLDDLQSKFRGEMNRAAKPARGGILGNAGVVGPARPAHLRSGFVGPMQTGTATEPATAMQNLVKALNSNTKAVLADIPDAILAQSGGITKASMSAAGGAIKSALSKHPLGKIALLAGKVGGALIDSADYYNEQQEKGIYAGMSGNDYIGRQNQLTKAGTSVGAAQLLMRNAGSTMVGVAQDPNSIGGIIERMATADAMRGGGGMNWGKYAGALASGDLDTKNSMDAAYAKRNKENVGASTAVLSVTGAELTASATLKQEEVIAPNYDEELLESTLGLTQSMRASKTALDNLNLSLSGSTLLDATGSAPSVLSQANTALGDPVGSLWRGFTKGTFIEYAGDLINSFKGDKNPLDTSKSGRVSQTKDGQGNEGINKLNEKLDKGIEVRISGEITDPSKNPVNLTTTTEVW